MSWSDILRPCSICPRDDSGHCEYKLVQPTGPRNASVMLVGEKPGPQENDRGTVFVGKAGQEIDETYLRLLGLPRHACYVTNTVKCYTGGSTKKPTSREIRGCAGEILLHEFLLVQPDLVILMGASACALVPDIWLEADHGIPRWVDDFMGTQRGVWVVPMYHPAAGMHNTWLMVPLLEDWEKVGRWWESGTEEWQWPVDDYAGKEDYRIVGHPSGDWLELVGDPEEDREPILGMGLDTENDCYGRLWSAQVSFRSGTGLFMVLDKPEERRLLQMWLHLLPMFGIPLFVHYQEHDIRMLLSMEGFEIPSHLRIVDTMHLAYHSQRLPQKLKALAKRVCGTDMASYDEVVMPVAREEVVGWLEEAYGMVPELDKRWYKKLKSGVVKAYGKLVPSPLSSDIKRIHTHTIKEVEPDQEPYSPWKAWRALREKLEEASTENEAVAAEHFALVEDTLGPMPRPGLDRVWGKGKEARERAKKYAVADADNTARVGIKLFAENGEVGKEVVRYDYDK